MNEGKERWLKRKQLITDARQHFRRLERRTEAISISRLPTVDQIEALDNLVGGSRRLLDTLEKFLDEAIDATTKDERWWQKKDGGEMWHAFCDENERKAREERMFKYVVDKL